MGPSPNVTGISPKEASAGTKITIRGENLGTSPPDLVHTMIFPLCSLGAAGHRAVILVEDFHSAVRRQSTPSMYTSTKS